MSYQPYVTGGNTGKKQNTYSTTTPTQSSTYNSNTSSYSYAPAPATTSTYSGGGYAPASSYGTPTNNSYSAASASPAAARTTPDFSQALDVPPPVQSSAGSGSSSNYGGGYGNTYKTSQSNAQTLNPPATNPGYSQAVAIPVTNTGGYGGDIQVASGTVASSALNSTTYSGGPTGGLVSEGNPQKCHKVDYEIKGHEMQLVEIELDPQETVIAEAGAMMFLDEGIDFKTKFGDGSTPKEGFFKKLMKAGGRLLMGESLFITHFTNQGGNKARVAFAAPYPGNILPMNLQNLNGKLICQKDAFLCAAKGTKLSIHFNKKIGSGLFGGEGFILQKLQGDGMAFVHAGGTVIRRELRGEKLRIDTGCVVAFTDGISFDVQFVPGLKSMFFGGEGLFLATLKGTGTVWMQSLPFSRLADRVIQHAPSAGGRRRGEGSALTGGMGDLVNGDGFGFNF